MKIKLLIACFSISLAIQSQISPTEIDQLVTNSLTAFNVPGIAVSVIKDGKVIHSKGYGVTSIVTNQKVDENTLFGIASNSKAFTAAALAILIDEGKLNWDDKVISYLPDFKMYNDYVTNEFTIRDLLTHRSGLGLGAGDLMIWPDGNNFTSKDIIHNLRFLKPVSNFRTQFDYDNLLYIVAGEVIAKVSGNSWSEFIESRITSPLSMNRTAGSFKRLKDTTNIATPHVPIQEKLKPISRYKNPILDAAGGIYSSVNDLNKWLLTLLNKGKNPENNNQLFSPELLNDMWSLQTIIPKTTIPPYNTHFGGYGLGWFLSDVKGYKEVTHTGGLEGMVTQVTMIPELNLGIIVLTNQQSGSAFTAITNTIKNSYLNIPKIDLVAIYSRSEKNVISGTDKVNEEVWKNIEKNKNDKNIKNKFEQLQGMYSDNWFGDITLTFKKNKLYFQSLRSKQLAGEVFYYKENIYAVKWNNAFFHADAFIFVSLDENGKPQNLKMKAISPLTDFSYDFHDLDFNRK
ncbi:serine hydrolase [Flavobacterium sp. LMO8]|uniref:serine hydrolase n=1 Tax=Flavobacterium sp. LMO8 TaxID=2654244 RepID=UPI0012920ED0|nr:serine hydrolase [Flavobacterium sp. LMO8]MQP24943.1 serine hydrolase [Flavobacterium sp. LMO8]